MWVLLSRGLGEAALVRALPDVVLVLAALVTQLGDGWFVLGLAGLLYYHPIRGLDRREAASLFALAGLAATCIIGLKVLFALPRPPGAATATAPVWLPGPLAEAFVEIATDEALGFPSGHGTASATVYGGLAYLLDRGRERDRALVAGTLIALVSLSRVVLELHYIVDVVAGAAFGLGLVAVGLWLPTRLGSNEDVRERFEGLPTRLFLAAALVGLLGALVASVRGYPGEIHDAVVGAGSGVGGAAGWWAVQREGVVDSEAIDASLPLPAMVVTAALAGGAWALVYRAEGLPLVVAGVVPALAITAVMGVPALLARVRGPEE